MIELQQDSERISLSIREAASALGVSEGLFRRWLPEIPHVRMGERILIPRESLKKWVVDTAAHQKKSREQQVQDILHAMSRTE